jgi:MFS family permease
MFVQACASAMLAIVGATVERTGPTPVLPVLVLAGFISGAAHGFLYPGLAALMADQTPDTRRGVVIGFFSAVFLVGNAGGAFLFGYVTTVVGYGAMWGLLTALLLVGLLLSLRLADTPRRVRAA